MVVAILENVSVIWYCSAPLAPPTKAWRWEGPESWLKIIILLQLSDVIANSYVNIEACIYRFTSGNGKGVKIFGSTVQTVSMSWLSDDIWVDIPQQFL